MLGKGKREWDREEDGGGDVMLASTCSML